MGEIYSFFDYFKYLDNPMECLLFKAGFKKEIAVKSKDFTQSITIKNSDKPIYFNKYVNKDIARRIIDVVSGAVHALDGHIQKVSNSIFLIAPYNYDITNEMAREEIKNKLSVSWLKNNGNN